MWNEMNYHIFFRWLKIKIICEMICNTFIFYFYKFSYKINQNDKIEQVIYLIINFK